MVDLSNILTSRQELLIASSRAENEDEIDLQSQSQIMSDIIVR